MTARIVIGDIGKRYRTRRGEVAALEGVNLQVEPGEFMCIVGPSGCGKSTLLRIIAGISAHDSGQIDLLPALATGSLPAGSLHAGSLPAGSIEARRKGLGQRTAQPMTAMVFQEYALFPWRTVLDNVAFGLEMRNVARAERYLIAREYLGRVGLARFAAAYPHELSGGMKQRVALARALANDPAVLLMDEPLAALDAQTRQLMQEELLRICEAERKTVVYVTHALDEAILLGDRVALMSARPGRIKQVYPIELPRPRPAHVRTTVAFNQLQATLWEELVQEVNATRQHEWEGR